MANLTKFQQYALEVGGMLTEEELHLVSGALMALEPNLTTEEENVVRALFERMTDQEVSLLCRVSIALNGIER